MLKKGGLLEISRSFDLVYWMWSTILLEYVHRATYQ